MGTMAYTVNYVDVATYWQEPVAQLNKGERATVLTRVFSVTACKYLTRNQYLSLKPPSFPRTRESSY